VSGKAKAVPKMFWPTTRYPADAKALRKQLGTYETKNGVLPGVAEQNSREAFVCQLIESTRRVKYVKKLLQRQIGPACADPSSTSFDPLKAAILALRAKNRDEACWLTFLFVHFGKHSRAGWRLVRDFYVGNGPNERWTWSRVSNNPSQVTAWIDTQRVVWTNDGVDRHFGNHRKYESLKETGSVIESYVGWVTPPRTHAALFAQAATDAGSSTPRDVFEQLYKSLDAVKQFGRTARFDFLAMLGKLGLAPIEPARTYLSSATGPKDGAKRLFGAKRAGKLGMKGMESELLNLGAALKVNQQVLEDAICNWQKSPSTFRPFRG
jgi:Alpha-glutamyl/putrescinyl thymine pyrophosphorylase clade 3